jgi:hypothetical protein
VSAVEEEVGEEVEEQEQEQEGGEEEEEEDLSELLQELEGPQHEEVSSDSSSSDEEPLEELLGASELSEEELLKEQMKIWCALELENNMMKWLQQALQEGGHKLEYKHYIASEFPENVRLDAAGDVEWMDHRIIHPEWSGTFERIVQEGRGGGCLEG